MGCGIVKVHILIIFTVAPIRKCKSGIHQNIPDSEKGLRHRQFGKGGAHFMSIHLKGFLNTVCYTQLLPGRFPIPPLDT